MTFCAVRLAGAGTLYEVEENPSGRALMRLFIVGAALLFSVSTTAAAQSRWTFSAGPEWSGVGNNSHIYGGRLRAQYDLLRPDRPLRLHLEFGGRWDPTQSYFNTLSDGSRPMSHSRCWLGRGGGRDRTGSRISTARTPGMLHSTPVRAVTSSPRWGWGRGCGSAVACSSSKCGRSTEATRCCSERTCRSDRTLP